VLLVDRAILRLAAVQPVEYTLPLPCAFRLHLSLLHLLHHSCKLDHIYICNIQTLVLPEQVKKASVSEWSIH
jgi:hypothetical protein